MSLLKIIWKWILKPHRNGDEKAKNAVGIILTIMLFFTILIMLFESWSISSLFFFPTLGTLLGNLLRNLRKTKGIKVYTIANVICTILFSLFVILILTGYSRLVVLGILLVMLSGELGFDIIRARKRAR